jgi:hypothetical protein
MSVQRAHRNANGATHPNIAGRRRNLELKRIQYSPRYADRLVPDVARFREKQAREFVAAKAGNDLVAPDAFAQLICDMPQ